MPVSRHPTKTPESDTRRAPIQHKQGTATTHVMAAAEHGLSGGGGALPFAERIQHSFGRHSVSGVVAHTGGAARQANESMGSMGYATGNHVAFRGAPDLHTAAHEAAHVIQQRAGVSLKGGVGESGDRYERHADAVAERVVQGKSAEDLLDQYAGGGAGRAVQRRGVQHQRTAPQAQQSTLQTTQRSGSTGGVTNVYRNVLAESYAVADGDADLREAIEALAEGHESDFRAMMAPGTSAEQGNRLVNFITNEQQRRRALDQLMTENAHRWFDRISFAYQVVTVRASGSALADALVTLANATFPSPRGGVVMQTVSEPERRSPEPEVRPPEPDGRAHEPTGHSPEPPPPGPTPTPRRASRPRRAPRDIRPAPTDQFAGDPAHDCVRTIPGTGRGYHVPPSNDQ